MRNVVKILCDKQYMLLCFCILCVYTNFIGTLEVHYGLALCGTNTNLTVSSNN